MKKSQILSAFMLILIPVFLTAQNNIARNVRTGFEDYSIQAVISDAASTPGDTIIIFPGNYDQTSIAPLDYMKIMSSVYYFTSNVDQSVQIYDSMAMMTMPGFSLNAVQEVEIIGLWFASGLGSGISMSDSSGNIIRGNYFQDINTGVQIANVNCQNSWIISNTFWSSSMQTGINSSGYNNIVYRNYFRDLTTGIMTATGGGDIRIINNSFNYCVNNGVNIQDNVTGQLINNLFMQIQGTAVAQTTGHNMADVSHNAFFDNMSDFDPGLYNSIGDIFVSIDNYIGVDYNDCRIVDPQSPLIDAGSKVEGVNEDYYALAPDIGWYESTFAGIFAKEQDFTDNKIIAYNTAVSSRDGGDLVFNVINDMGGPIKMSIYTRDGSEVLSGKTLETPPGVASFAMKVPSGLEPGTYYAVFESYAWKDDYSVLVVVEK